MAKKKTDDRPSIDANQVQQYQVIHESGIGVESFGWPSPDEIRSKLLSSFGKRGGKKSGENRRQDPEWLAARKHALELAKQIVDKPGDMAAEIINGWKLADIRCPESQIRLWLIEWRKEGLIPRRKKGRRSRFIG